MHNLRPVLLIRPGYWELYPGHSKVFTGKYYLHEFRWLCFTVKFLTKVTQ